MLKAKRKSLEQIYTKNEHTVGPWSKGHAQEQPHMVPMLVPSHHAIPGTVMQKGCSTSTTLLCGTATLCDQLDEKEDNKKSGQQSLNEKERENTHCYITPVACNRKLKEGAFSGTAGKTDAQCDQVNW